MYDQLMNAMGVGGKYDEIKYPKIEEYDLDAPRFAVPASLKAY